jgi:hypothetical protein
MRIADNGGRERAVPCLFQPPARSSLSRRGPRPRIDARAMMDGISVHARLYSPILTAGYLRSAFSNIKWGAAPPLRPAAIKNNSTINKHLLRHPENLFYNRLIWIRLLYRRKVVAVARKSISKSRQSRRKCHHYKIG